MIYRQHNHPDRRVRAYWYNMPAAGQRLSLMGGQQVAEVYSSLHLYLGCCERPEIVLAQVLTSGGQVAHEHEFDLTNHDTSSLDVQQSPDETMHLWARTETLPEPPASIVVTVKDGHGESRHTIPCCYYRLQGRVTDFSGQPFCAFLRVSTDSFDDSGIGCWSDARGCYSLTLPERTYNAVFVDDESYGVNTLEAWGWHIIMDEDQTLDFRVGTGEVYGLTAWPNNGGYPTYFAYFRPMALHVNADPTTNQEPMLSIPERQAELGGTSYRVADLDPKLELADIEATINGQTVEIISLQPVLETGHDGTGMPAYLVQISRKGLARSGKQTLCLQYRRIMEHNGLKYWAESMGYYQFVLNSGGQQV